MLTLLTGTELNNRYVIHHVVGTGGNASVWRASDKHLNRDVALKRLLKSGRPSAEELSVLLDEARKNAQLVHTNIVQVYDTITVDDDHLIVMEYVDGQSLHDIFRERARKGETMPLDRGVALLRDVLSGVAFAHSKNICHRDLSPLNILVTLSGIPKIADFGIARVLTGRSSSSSGSPAQGGTGNPNFMSPEQARGEPADFLSDLFMVGIIGYLLITNRHPFTHPSGLFSIPELLKDGEYIPESPRGPAILTTSQQRLFREYAAVVMRLLNKEKAGRFSTARDAIDAIDAVTPTLDCPACGERVPEHHKFCGFCGGSLNALKPRSALIPPAALPAGASADELVEEGFQLSRVKQWDAAIELYRRALETDPNHQKAWRNLGYALNRVGRYDEAVRALSSGLSLAPAYPPHLSNFHYERSYAEANLKQYEEALADIETALRYQPDSLRNLYLRARVLLYRGDLEAANRDAHEILKAVPDHAGALRLLDELGEQ